MKKKKKLTFRWNMFCKRKSEQNSDPKSSLTIEHNEYIK